MEFEDRERRYLFRVLTIFVPGVPTEDAGHEWALRTVKLRIPRILALKWRRCTPEDGAPWKRARREHLGSETSVASRVR